MLRRSPSHWFIGLSLGALVTGAAATADASSTLPRGYMPTHFPGTEQPLAQGNCQLTYSNGPLISQVQAVPVFWGSVDSTVQGWAQSYIQQLVNSQAWDALSEYNAGGQKIVRGTSLPAVPITPMVQTSNTVDDNNGGIGQELEAQIKAGVLPKPTLDSTGHTNTIYVIFFAPGITIDGAGGAQSCVQFCGYHESWTYSGTGKSTPYAVIPDMSTGGCSMGCAPQGAGETVALGITVSHEMSEATTDEGVGENNIGWYDNTCNGEIGDICAPGSGQGNNAGYGTLFGQAVQYEWSNENGQCELTNPSIGPQGGCTSNAQCSAPTPVCDTSAQTCVGCMANTDCSGATPTCDKTTHTCKACGSNSDCSGSTPVCVTSGAGAGACVQCTTNAQCTSSAPVCSSNKCTGCKSDSDCTDPNNPVCNTGTGACGPSGSTSSSSGGGSSSSGTSSGSSGGGSSSGFGGSSGSSGASGSGSGSGGAGSSSGAGDSSGDAFGTTSSSSGCSVSPEGGSAGLAGIGLLLGLAAITRRRNRA